MDWFWHFLSYMWAWPNWIGNISADIIVAILVSLLWPQVRKAISGWFDLKLFNHLNHHHEKLKQHINDHMEEVHKKLDK